VASFHRGATLVSGMIAPAGDVTIELRPGAGSRMPRPAHLSGTLHDGHLEATGTMLNGRTVSLTWHRNWSSSPGALSPIG
jgi:hypothetical protein